MDTATTMIIMTTVTTIPAIDNPIIEALPSLLACCGSSTAVLLATTVHVRRTRRQLRKSLANFDENLLDGCDTGSGVDPEGARGAIAPPIKIYQGESIFSPPQSFSLFFFYFSVYHVAAVCFCSKCTHSVPGSLKR